MFSKGLFFLIFFCIFLFPFAFLTSIAETNSPYWAGYESKKLLCNECDHDFYMQIKYSKDGKKYKVDFNIDDPSFRELEGNCEGKVFANGVLEKKVCDYEGNSIRRFGGTVEKLKLTGTGSAGDAAWIDKRILAKKKASPKPIILAKKKSKKRKFSKVTKNIQTKTSPKNTFSVLSTKDNIYLSDVQIYLTKNPKTPNLLGILGTIVNIKTAQKKKDTSQLQLSLNSLKKLMKNNIGFSAFLSKREKARALAKRKREKARALAKRKREIAEALARRNIIKENIQIARTYEKFLTAYAARNMLKDTDTVQKILPYIKKITTALKSSKLEVLNPINEETTTFILSRPTLKNVALKLNLKEKAKRIKIGRALAKRKGDMAKALARRNIIKENIQIARTYEKFLTAYAARNMLKDTDTVQKILPYIKKITTALKSSKLEVLNPINEETTTFILSRPTLKNVALKLNLKEKAKRIKITAPKIIKKQEIKVKKETKLARQKEAEELARKKKETKQQPTVYTGKISVKHTDPAWKNGEGYVPDKGTCESKGGKGMSPPMKVSNIPPNAVKLFLHFSDENWESEGAHGVVSIKVPKGKNEMTIPSFKGETDELPKGIKEESAHECGNCGGGVYLGPCSGGQGHSYYVVIYAKDKNNEELSKVRLELGNH